MNNTAVIENKRNKITPQLFALFVGMASILMMFGGWTSAYIVKNAAGNWLEFSMPSMFFVSTITIILSSVALHISYVSYKKQNEGLYKGMLVVAFVLGILFIGFQYMGWKQLFGLGVQLKGNVSGSFTYLLTGAHALHVLGGIAAISIALIRAFSVKFKYSQKRKNGLELVLYYWHFVDVLWIYLLIFLMNVK
ncbi:MAG: cytochrome c oxidase subunit 3 [Saprospiraceae bacterium]